MKSPINSNHVPILGQNRILITSVPGAVEGTFDVTVDTSAFSYGVPLAVQTLLQAVAMFVPAAYQTMVEIGRETP